MLQKFLLRKRCVDVCLREKEVGEGPHDRSIFLFLFLEKWQIFSFPSRLLCYLNQVIAMWHVIIGFLKFLPYQLENIKCGPD